MRGVGRGWPLPTAVGSGEGLCQKICEILLLKLRIILVYSKKESYTYANMFITACNERGNMRHTFNVCFSFYHCCHMLYDMI